MSSIGLSGNSSDKTEMLSAIKNLISEDNFGSASNFGYDNHPAANIYWKIGDKVNSNMGITYSGYVKNYDLDGNSTPFDGMIASQLLT